MTRPDRPSPLQARLTRPGAVAPADAAAWRGMLAATADFASPLLGPEFAELAARARSDAWVAVFVRDDEPVGVFAHHRRPGGLARPIGAPWSDAHALITWPDRPLPWREALAAAGLRSFRFSQLIDPHRVFAGVEVEGAVSHLLRLEPDGGEAGWERLRAGSPKRFKNIRRLEHKLAREVGPLTLAVEREREPFARLLAWKREQFARTGAHDVLHPAWSRAFMEAALDLDGPALCGQLLVLRAGGRLVAAHFGVRAGAVFHPWIAAFDPELRSYSPGVIFLSLLVREPLGLSRYELSSGCDEYKTVFADAEEAVAAGVADLRATAGAARDRAPPLVRKLRSRLDHIAEVDLTLADRVHGVARAVLDAPRLVRRAGAAPGEAS